MSAEYADDLVGENAGGNTEKVEVSQDSNNNRYQGKSYPPQRGPFKPPMVGQEIVTLSEKIILPIKEFPRYNFVGKLLGPKGSTMKHLQTVTRARISILGRGSTKDRKNEEELSKGGDPQHEHFKEALHVLIQVKAPKIEAHRRLAAALREINKFMGPGNEEMQQELHTRDIEEHHHPILGAEKGLQAPIIRVGIPPPGAIILSEQPHLARSMFPRKEERLAPRDSYAYDIAYKRYPETSDRGTFRRGEKRSAPPTNGFVLKRYKDEPYSSAPY